MRTKNIIFISIILTMFLISGVLADSTGNFTQTTTFSKVCPQSSTYGSNVNVSAVPFWYSSDILPILPALDTMTYTMYIWNGEYNTAHSGNILFYDQKDPNRNSPIASATFSYYYLGVGQRGTLQIQMQNHFATSNINTSAGAYINTSWTSGASNLWYKDGAYNVPASNFIGPSTGSGGGYSLAPRNNDGGVSYASSGYTNLFSLSYAIHDTTLPVTITLTPYNRTTYKYSAKNYAGTVLTALTDFTSAISIYYYSSSFQAYVYDYSNNSYAMFSNLPNYTINVFPKTAGVNTQIQGTIINPNSSDTSSITAIAWYYVTPGSAKDEYGNYPVNVFFESGSSQYQMNYVLKSGVWYGWNNATSLFDYNKGATMPNPVNFIVPVSGNVTVGCYIFTIDGAMQNPTTQVNIGDATKTYTIIFQATDTSTGQFIYNPTPHFDIRNMISDKWTNLSGSPYDGHATQQFNLGTVLNMYANATGYTPVSKTGYTVQGNDIYTFLLSPTAIGSSNLSFTNVMVNVKATTDGVKYTALSGATCEIVTLDVNQTNKDQFATTNNAGSATIQMINQSSITGDVYAVLTVTKSGYAQYTKTFKPTGSLMVIDVFLQATNIVNPTQTTLIPVITTQPTINPNMTPIQPITGDAWVCQAQLPPNSSPIDGLKNGIACAGVKQAKNQNYVLALVIMGILAMICGKYGKSMGVMLGIVGGFIISIGMELIPVWMFVAVIIICGIIIAVKMFGDK